MVTPEIRTLFPATDKYYSYFNDDPESCTQAVSDLASYVDVEGPFDGIFCFSTGASLGATLLIQYANSDNERSLSHPPFKLAVFFSGLEPADPKLLAEKGERKLIKPSEEPLIRIPTAHIWGINDRKWSKSSQNLSEICEKNSRNVFVHEGAHEIPGAKDRTGLMGAVHAIWRTIEISSMVL